MRRITWLVLLVLPLFVWYAAADRYVPWSHEARVKSWIVPIAPTLSGRMVEVAATELLGQRIVDDVTGERRLLLPCTGHTFACYPFNGPAALGEEWAAVEMSFECFGTGNARVRCGHLIEEVHRTNGRTLVQLRSCRFQVGDISPVRTDAGVAVVQDPI